MRPATFVLIVGFAFPSAAFAAVSSDVRRACMDDYYRLCSYTGGNVARASACMRAHRSQVSVRCKNATEKGRSHATKYKHSRRY